MEEARHFFDKFTGNNTSDFFALPQSGSSRKNFIGKTNDESFVITSNENLLENESFFYFTKLFSELNLNTPKIFSISEDRRIYAQEYLGSKTFSEIITEEGLSERVKSLVKQTLEKLYRLQTSTLGKIDYSKTFEYTKYDDIPILHDLNYFKFLFVDVVEMHYHKSTLLSEFKALSDKIENLSPKFLMIRDFQARNIMVNDNDEVFFIDYQAAMEGPAMYDVISFLYQAKANFPDEFRNEMLEYYFSLFENEEDRLELRKSVMPIRLIRNIQVLGVYGLRGLIQRKEHFIKSIFPGIENLYNTSLSWDEMGEFPELKKLIENLHTEETLNKIKVLINH